MKRALLLALVACEKAGGQTYAIGWEGPKPGERVEVISTSTFGEHVFSEHAVFEHASVDGDRITSEKVRYLDFRSDGRSIPRANLDIVEKNGRLEVHGDVPADQREMELQAARLTFADPAPRKRLTLHQFHLGERYKLRADEADALGLDTTDVGLTLRAAHDDTLRLDIDGTVMRDGANWQLRGTIETNGPNYRYFHQIIELTSELGVLKLDHLQKRP